MGIEVTEYYQKVGAVPNSNGVKQAPKRENSNGMTAANYSFTKFVPKHCQAVKTDGSSCRARPLKNGQLCWFHDNQVRAKDDTDGTHSGS